MMIIKGMCKVLPVSSHTNTQPSTPPVDCIINDMLLQTKSRSCSNQSPLQISNVQYGCEVDTLLYDAPDFIIH